MTTSALRFPLDFSTVPEWRHPLGMPESLRVERTLIMGVLNTTPDSFSDGGQHNSFPDAIAHAERLVSEGADIIDVGGESTRPGGERVSEAEELARTRDVVAALADKGIAVSIDTMRASVAAAAVESGAIIVNDVSAGLADPEMLSAVAGMRTSLGVQPVYVGMHWRGHSQEAMARAGYTAVGEDVARELSEQLDKAIAAGIDPKHIVADPGFGFSKTGNENWDLFDQYGPCEDLGFPILVGVSRKRFLAALDCDRDAATAAISGLCQLRKTWAVRVHNVAQNVANVRVMQRLMAGPEGRSLGLGAEVSDRNYSVE